MRNVKRPPLDFSLKMGSADARPHTRPGGQGCSSTSRVLTAASPGSGLPVGALPASSSAPTLSACPRHCHQTCLPPQSPTYHVTPWLKTAQRPRCFPKVAQDHCLLPLLGCPSSRGVPPSPDTQGSSGPILSTLRFSPLLSECSHFPISNQDALNYL